MEDQFAMKTRTIKIKNSYIGWIALKKLFWSLFLVVVIVFTADLFADSAKEHIETQLELSEIYDWFVMGIIGLVFLRFIYRIVYYKTITFELYG